ncbi:acyltransferase family protein [Inconstantimicrobium porci]|nr:acyltransferase [Inconstantimicrobium porci]
MSKNYSSKIKRRVFSLLIPYVMWQIIIAIKYVLQNEYTFSIKNFIYRTFYLVTWPIDGPMWYVYAIFLLALISPVFLLMFKNKKVGWCMVLIIIVFLRAQGKFNIPVFTRIANHGYVGNIIWYFPSYLVGAFYGRFYDELNEEKSLVYVLSLLFLACLLQGVLPGIFYDITIRMMPIMSLFLLPVIPSLKDKWVYRLTFLMYAMHQPLIADVKPHINNLYKVVLMPDSVRNILTRVIILAIDIALAAAIYIVLKKFAPKGLNALTGSRD